VTDEDSGDTLTRSITADAAGLVTDISAVADFDDPTLTFNICTNDPDDIDQEHTLYY
jgi:hypothetical protein